MAVYTPRPNDRYTLTDLPREVLDGIDFWADRTPDEPAFKAPRRRQGGTGFDTVSWSEWRDLRQRTSSWLVAELDFNTLPPPAGSSKGVVAFLVESAHDVILAWPALSALGYTCQFLSPLQTPFLIAKMITKTMATHVLHTDVDQEWLAAVSRELKAACVPPRSPAELVEIPATMSVEAQLRAVQEGKAVGTPAVEVTSHHPEPYVILHSFGSTANPKLYPISTQTANDSGHTAAYAALLYPAARRWRCQLITSLPFHYSYQNPVWRALICGTAISFPSLSHKSDWSHRFQPDAVDILESLWHTDSDTIYCSPNGLEAMLEKAHRRDAPCHWKVAVSRLKDAHTGAAPLSVQKAECFEQYGLNVFQVFAMTEAGLMFYGGKQLTGDVTWLKTVPEKDSNMLWHRESPDTDVYQLWLAGTLGALHKDSIKLEPFPGNPEIEAWNTLDTFSPAPHPGLWIFAGRQDDWIRCTNGAACRALEVEAYVLKGLRKVLGFEEVAGATVLGTGRPCLGLVVEHHIPTETTADERDRLVALRRDTLAKVLEGVNTTLLHFPLMITSERVEWTDQRNPVRVTGKGSLQRRLNENAFAHVFEKADKNTPLEPSLLPN
ncbi:unnamed protein product [Parajaminaea phylloscopi]